MVEPTYLDSLSVNELWELNTRLMKTHFEILAEIESRTSPMDFRGVSDIEHTPTVVQRREAKIHAARER